MFFPDGSGAIDYYNVVFAGRDEFQWELFSGGRQLRFQPPIWRVGVVDLSIDSKNGRCVLRLEYDADPEVNIPNERVQCEFFRSSKSLRDYIPPAEPLE